MGGLQNYVPGCNVYYMSKCNYRFILNSSDSIPRTVSIIQCLVLMDGDVVFLFCLDLCIVSCAWEAVSVSWYIFIWYIL